MKTIVKNAMILFAITLISGLALGFVYELTKAPIEAADENRTQAAYQEVLSEADAFEVYSSFSADMAADVLKDASIASCTIDDVVVGTRSGETTGYVITVTDGEGYAGDIQFAVGINTEGSVVGISFLSISESPGLGMTAKDDPTWKEQFFNTDTEAFAVVKSGAGEGEINAISGATISSEAITNGVNAALAYYRAQLGGEPS